MYKPWFKLLSQILIFFTLSTFVIHYPTTADDTDTLVNETIASMIKAIKENNTRLRNKTSIKLRDIGEPAVDPLIQAYNDETSIDVQRYIIDPILSFIGTDHGSENIKEFIADKLDDRNLDIQSSAVNGLVKLGVIDAQESIDIKHNIALARKHKSDQKNKKEIALDFSLDPNAFYADVTPLVGMGQYPHHYIPSFHRGNCDELKKQIQYYIRKGLNIVILHHDPTLKGNKIDKSNSKTKGKFYFLKSNSRNTVEFYRNNRKHKRKPCNQCIP